MAIAIEKRQYRCIAIAIKKVAIAISIQIYSSDGIRSDSSDSDSGGSDSDSGGSELATIAIAIS